MRINLGWNHFNMNLIFSHTTESHCNSIIQQKVQQIHCSEVGNLTLFILVFSLVTYCAVWWSILLSRACSSVLDIGPVLELWISSLQSKYSTATSTLDNNNIILLLRQSHLFTGNIIVIISNMPKNIWSTDKAVL